MSENRYTKVATDTQSPEHQPLLRNRRERRAPEVSIEPRYADLRDPELAATLAAEDAAESAGADPLERLTCRTHRRWVHQCVHSPQHVIVVTGHRWCRSCEHPADVAVDELTWTVSVTCPKCRRSPQGNATRQIARTCRASMAAVMGVTS